MEFGQSELAKPASLASDLDPAAAAGNALVFEQSGLAYSQSTGHYYKLDGQTRDFAAAISAAETGTVQSQSGYLARLESMDELEIGGWFARQRSWRKTFGLACIKPTPARNPRRLAMDQW